MAKYRDNADPQSNDHPYDPEEFAAKFGLTAKAAAIILYSNGPSRVACEAAARAFVEAIGARAKPATSPR